MLSEDGSLAAMVAPEYPSPVSVLDNLVYADESPLPGKRVPEFLGICFPPIYPPSFLPSSVPPLPPPVILCVSKRGILYMKYIPF